MCLFRLRCRLGLYVRLPVVDAPHLPFLPRQHLPPRRKYAGSVPSAAIQWRQRMVALAAVLSNRHRILLPHQHPKANRRTIRNHLRLLRHHLPERWPAMETASANHHIYGRVLPLRLTHGRRVALHLPLRWRTRRRLHRNIRRHRKHESTIARNPEKQ